jgi:DNA-binding transcriptional ArsR family regulator
MLAGHGGTPNTHSAGGQPPIGAVCRCGLTASSAARWVMSLSTTAVRPGWPADRLPRAGTRAYRDEVIELRMAADDLTRLRFGYSPVAEAIDSLNALYSGRVHPLQRRWADDTRERLSDLDTTLLRAIAPPGRIVITPPVDLSAAASVQHQLRLLADWPPHQLRAELEDVWRGRPMAAAARDVISDGPAGARRVAAALATYWDIAIAPHWDQIRAVLEADIAYRAGQAARGGISAMINDLHPQLRLQQSTIRLSKPASRTYDVGGTGVLLVPSVFGGSNLSFDPGSLGMPAIAYSPRGLGAVWEKNGARTDSYDPVSALLGKGRTAILRSAGPPRTTTDLARELHLSGATVSVHLSTLKRCGMVTSWRSGRRVFYQRTPLASSILAAASSDGR